MTVEQKKKDNERVIRWGIISYIIISFFIFFLHFFTQIKYQMIGNFGELMISVEVNVLGSLPYILIGTIYFVGAWLLRGEEKKSIGIELDDADITELRQWAILVNRAIRDKCKEENRMPLSWEIEVKDYYLNSPEKNNNPDSPKY